jgi:hypothetical protein
VAHDEYDALSGPFGTADGAAQQTTGFVTFTDNGRWGDLEFSGKSFRSRVFVGRRGSGKSRYLKEYERAADKKFLVFRQRNAAVSLTHLSLMHREIQRDSERESFWIALWRAAIYLSLGSFILNERQMDRSALSSADEQRLHDILRRKIGDSHTPHTVISCLNRLLSATECNRNKLEALSNDPIWDTLEYIVEKSTENSKPIAIFIDSLDENFRHAPTESAECQIGLLLYLGRTLGDPSQSNRVHIFVTVRDVVISQFQVHEHGERYTTPSHRKMLDWTKLAARYFFEKKIGMLPRNLLRRPQAADPFERWLGVRCIKNTPRQSEEEIGEFLLRHTRFLPREIVEIGNALANSLSGSSGDSEADARDIWSVVIRHSRLVGERALAVLFDHFIARAGAVFADDRTKDNYKGVLRAGFDAFLKELKSDVFDEPTLRRAERRFLQIIGERAGKGSFATLLWQHGLIGYMHSDEAVEPSPELWLYYHAAGGVEGSTAYGLPSAERYRLHACLVDTRILAVTFGSPAIDSTNDGLLHAA